MGSLHIKRIHTTPRCEGSLLRTIRSTVEHIGEALVNKNRWARTLLFTIACFELN